MHLFTKNKFKNFFVIMLSIVMATTLVFATACNDNSGGDDDTENPNTTETVKTDYQLIKNGDFEFSTKDTTDYPYTSSIMWTRSTDSDKNSSLSSTSASGIIDTSETAFNKLEKKEKPTNAQGESINPGTPYSNKLISSSEYDYEDEEKRVNPQVDGTKILMINNKSSEEGLGTAQKFKSSSTITIPVDSYALLSIWVRTDNLKMKSTEGKPGAYVLITPKVGSSTYENFEIRGIDTNGTWSQIKTFIKGSELANTTLTLTVGLGRGNGTFKKDYVEGFAFFDNIEAKIYNVNEYNKLASKPETFEVVDKDEVYTPNYTKDAVYALSYEYNRTPELLDLSTSEFGYNKEIVKDYDLESGNEIKTVANKNAVTNENIKAQLEDIPSFLEDKFITYFDFVNPSSGYYLTNKITIPNGKYHYITFYAKTYAEYGSAKIAKVELVNETIENKTTDVSALANFTTETVTDSVYDKWVKYTILVSNPTDTDTKYQLKITFGNDEENRIESQYELQKGYAIFAGLSGETISEENYNTISTNTNTVKVNVYGKYANYEDKDEVKPADNYGITTDTFGKFEIETKPTTYMPGYKFKGDKSSIVGIVNSKYNEAYIAGNYLTQAEGDVLHSLKKEGNEYAQLIMLKNKEVNKPATLLSASSNSVSANSFSIVSVKVKVTGNTVAKVRLVEVEPTSEGKFKTITLTTDTESKELITSVKSTDLAIDDGWTEVRFFIASGNKDIEYKVEISLDNEKRDGAIFVNTSLSDITTITTLDTFNSIKQEYVDSAKNLDTLEDFSNPVLHTRAPAKVLTTDENGNDVESQLTFDPQEVFTANNLYVFANFSTVNADEVIDNRSEVEEDTDHDHEHDHEHEDEGYQATTDLGLQISSIILALALIVVLVVVVIKNNRKNTSDRKVQVKSYYDRNTREKAMENIAKKKAMIDIDVDADEEVEEYDYEAAQLVEEEPTEEVESAENVEEQVIDMEEVATAPIEEVETNETPNEETSTEDSNS